MAKSLNRVQLIGNLTKDAETRYTGNGTPVSSFTVATSESWKDKGSGEWQERATFHNCILWSAEKLASYMTKGKRVYVEGSIQNRSYDDKDGNKRYVTELKVSEVMLLDGAGKRDEPAPAISVPDFEPAGADDDSELPF